MPARVTVYEVGPRDGLQNVATLVPTAVKIAFIEALLDAGLPAVEATSFVSAKSVPQLADGREVMEALRSRTTARLPVLVPNEKGLDAAMAAGAREVAVFTAASEEFNRRNVNASIEESIARFRPVASRALGAGLRLRGYVSMAFGCPFQGDVPLAAVVSVTEQLVALGCHEISIGDTIGVGVPSQVHDVVAALAPRVGLGALALHLHDTWGRALANVTAALDDGVTTFDASAGGLGGCPYAPGATGNLATEDLVALLDAMNVETGVDLERLVDASLTLAAATGLALPSRAVAAARARRRRPQTG